MLNSKTRLLARERIEIAIEERWTPLASQISATTSEFVKAGGAGGSRMQLHILGLYEDELDIQTSVAWGQLSRVLAVVDIGPLESLAVDLKAFMVEVIEWITSGLLQRLETSSHLRQAQPSAIDPMKRLTERKAHAIRKFYSEIDLFVAGLEQTVRLAQNDGTTNVNIYGGQVGVLQTGTYSTASMTVHLDSTSKHEIARALDIVEKALGDAAHMPFNRAELSEMVRESKCELDKPVPNVSRLRSLMIGVATSIQTVASLRPAYDVIKGGLALIGVTLP